MCGIAGYSTLETGEKVAEPLIEKMMATLLHRGPDQDGKIVYPHVGLANRRLSIIDIKDGQQPIYNEDKTVVVVFNGEIYNYPELRREAEKRGHTFRTKTDTEILVHLYEDHGIDFVKMLNGMFAFALYDIPKQEFYLARDRFGVKPLVYFYKEKCLYFASEIKALKVLPQFDPATDPEAISAYLGLFFIPDPWTIYKNVRKLRPGHYLRYSKEGLDDVEYYDLDYSQKTKISVRQAEDQLIDLFRKSVHRQLFSDVPVGVLLSGGMDSRSVLAATSERNPKTTSFTITFDEKGYNEGSQAALWARVFNSEHKTLNFTDEQFCDRLLSRQKHLDEPYGIWCNVAMEEMAHYIKQNDFKVILSGEGGDELLCGYPTLHAANIARYYRMIPKCVREKIIAPLIMHLPAQAAKLPLSFKLKSFAEADHPDPLRNFHGFKEIVRRKYWAELLTPEGYDLVKDHDPFMVYEQYRSKVQDWDLIDALSYLDFKGILSGCLFVGNDNAFMAASVELRVPFMDNDLMDFSTQLPVDVRFHPLKTKHLLRNAFTRFCSQRASFSKKDMKGYFKQGFEVPANVWLIQGRFQELLKKILSPERVRRTGFFRPEVVSRLVNEQISLKENNERILQAIMSLVLFLDGNYGSNGGHDA